MSLALRVVPFVVSPEVVIASLGFDGHWVPAEEQNMGRCGAPDPDGAW